MPKKNKVPVQPPAGVVEAEPENVVVGKEGFEIKPEKPVVLTCGHINKQHTNAKGKLENLACTLPKGHAGDHQAAHTKNVANHVYNNKGTMVEEHFDQVEAVAFWGDAAGIPAADIKEPPAKQLSQFQKDLVAEILKKNPDMTAKEAVAEAQISPIWLAANV